MNAQIVEAASAAAHAGWMRTKSAQGVTSRLAEDGEELMVPYDQLSEKAKDLDRGTVRSVIEALHEAGYEIVDRDSWRRQ